MTDAREAMFQRVTRCAKAHMDHDYLAKRKVRQAVSPFHFDLGYAILQSAAVPESEAERVLTAVLLLEQGLSIHDEIDEWGAEQQGLVVLAGDYDSSKYYLILAELGDRQLMHELCEAVVRINEAKMDLLMASPLSLDVYMERMSTIEAELLRALVRHYHPNSGAWMAQVDEAVRNHILAGGARVRVFTRGTVSSRAREGLLFSAKDAARLRGTWSVFDYALPEEPKGLQAAEGKR
ncbi:heptaprenyl diphosphate synthase component 1 [Alicyclobacillus mali (ex Roth et al. 2021)]|uniref:heptaprenyl diphosphate synthase component 1 n=1 Tax=Alicyclobacillus mali (ex Roth et al. 2021) TaxID=1123961 RepID=UPI000A5147A4|nr:heptaprenyl diphosphate synthase component 1 [Alicyclobacillus mali (ex Roth et al. 2021)]